MKNFKAVTAAKIVASLMCGVAVYLLRSIGTPLWMALVIPLAMYGIGIIAGLLEEDR